MLIISSLSTPSKHKSTMNQIFNHGLYLKAFSNNQSFPLVLKRQERERDLIQEPSILAEKILKQVNFEYEMSDILITFLLK